MELKNLISIYDNILPVENFNKLLKVCKSLNWEEAEIGSGLVHKNIRKTKKCALEDISNSMTKVHWYNVMENIFLRNVGNYVNKNNIKTIYFSGIESIQVLKYGKSDHYTWHYDSCPRLSRTFSCIYFLNENYEGGELCFRNPDGTGEFAIPKRENRMIVWPSCFLYPHTVKPVINGERYSIVAWTT